jgi:hypothetical protein
MAVQRYALEFWLNVFLDPLLERGREAYEEWVKLESEKAATAYKGN